MRRTMTYWSEKCFIVAEMGANHHQSFQRAVALIRAAKTIGADAVKIQMFTPEQMAEETGEKIASGPWSGLTLRQIYEKAAMPLEWIPKLKKIANDEQILLFATVFHPDMVDEAENLKMPIYKIASFEITWPALIEKAASTGKPVIISTGSAEYKEIEAAVKAAVKYHGDVALLKCTSQYPAPLERMNLITIPALEHVFKVDVGLSDHTEGIVAPVVAVSLGAKIIEKHLTLDGRGLDGGFSILPDRFNVMVGTIRAAEKALGRVDYGGEKTYHRKMIGGKMLRTIWNEV